MCEGGFINLDTGPWLGAVYSRRLYAQPKNVTSVIKITDDIEVLIIEEISIISAIKLIDGGTAMLAATNKNHMRDILGRIFKIPFVRRILRV